MKSTGPSEVEREHHHLSIIAHDSSLLGFVLAVSGFPCLHKSYIYYSFQYLLLPLLLHAMQTVLAQLDFS